MPRNGSLCLSCALRPTQHPNVTTAMTTAFQDMFVLLGYLLSLQRHMRAYMAKTTTIARKISRTMRATPIMLVCATCRVPFGLTPVMAAMAATRAAAMSHVYQVMLRFQSDARRA